MSKYHRYLIDHSQIGKDGVHKVLVKRVINETSYLDWIIVKTFHFITEHFMTCGGNPFPNTMPDILNRVRGEDLCKIGIKSKERWIDGSIMVTAYSLPMYVDLTHDESLFLMRNSDIT